MAFLFWLFWVLDLLIAVIALWGAGFRSSFGAGTDINTWVIIGMILVLAASLTLRFAFKLRLASLIVAALPLLVALIASFIDSRRSA
ncbi:MAG: hypothetical protein L6Q97_25710 [Thermoanaerobaculia bacterium]|nr:hypothetical protein [Thermoanaerobaculia bacterium]